MNKLKEYEIIFGKIEGTEATKYRIRALDEFEKLKKYLNLDIMII